MIGSGVTPIGITNYRSSNLLFGIKDADRTGHIYVIGKTGVGKSTLLLNMAVSDIERANGIFNHRELISPFPDWLYFKSRTRLEEEMYHGVIAKLKELYRQ